MFALYQHNVMYNSACVPQRSSVLVHHHRSAGCKDRRAAGQVFACWRVSPPHVLWTLDRESCLCDWYPHLCVSVEKRQPYSIWLHLCTYKLECQVIIVSLLFNVDHPCVGLAISTLRLCSNVHGVANL